MNLSSYTPIIFEHRRYGTFLVIDMADLDDEITDDIWLAEQVLCLLPGGRDAVVMRTSEGKLTRIKVLH